MYSIPRNRPLISFSLYVFLMCLGPTLARRCHVINFRSRNLFPEGLTWDPSAQHFIVGFIHQRTIHAVSDRGVIETLISDSSLPENVSFAGLVVDTVYNRLLAAVHALEPLPPFDALAAYDLRTGRRLFLARLTDGDSSVVKQLTPSQSTSKATPMSPTPSVISSGKLTSMEHHPSYLNLASSLLFPRIPTVAPVGLTGSPTLAKGTSSSSNLTPEKCLKCTPVMVRRGWFC